ncbi:hypothetical protein LP419_11520 [Massilia sp. H-1]|nr:hypothetical protein LP419_11520 [Massilia sp. H-1]
MTGGVPFKNVADQTARGRIALPSNTTLIGVGSDARIVNGEIQIKHVDNVIVRNLTLANPCDIAPEWDPDDGSMGNWNSRYDGILVDAATHVWIDHNSFTDAPVTDDKLPVQNGKLEAVPRRRARHQERRRLRDRVEQCIRAAPEEQPGRLVRQQHQG